MNDLERYKTESLQRSNTYKNNKQLQESCNQFTKELVAAKYAHNYFWMGVPILQLPQDMMALQEIIWETKPYTIIETGIAWGGSLLFSASMLELLERAGKIEYGDVVGIDIEIRPHTKEILENNQLIKTIIHTIEGSSIDQDIIEQVRSYQSHTRTMVILDSNHTHDHVLAELRAYAPMVSKGCYCIVNDTGIEDFPVSAAPGRPWGKGNNPKTAVHEFLKENNDFVIDKDIENKLLITGSPDGYLRKVK